ncbi:MAG TPA: hypothetical protein VLF60_01835 [Candidatus Saccharimonadales bacterium]|nr:hypothetical protein [Candidatus Saccharimonadales bacterium]
MQKILNRIAPIVALLVVVTSGIAPTVAAHAVATPPTSNTEAQKTAERLANIKTKGDAEITRRLTALNTLSGKITAAKKLTTTDKATLTAEVTAEVSGLTALKTKLDGETSIAAAAADAQSILTEYRVYALIMPKVALIKTADDQQAVQAKLTALAAKIQTRLTTAKNNGKDVAALQAKLTDMTAKTTAANNLSIAVEAKVITLKPTDYNNDHKILGGYRDQLKTAHSDDQAALADAKSIVASLKTL